MPQCTGERSDDNGADDEREAESGEWRAGDEGEVVVHAGRNARSCRSASTVCEQCRHGAARAANRATNVARAGGIASTSRFALSTPRRQHGRRVGASCTCMVVCEQGQLVQKGLMAMEADEQEMLVHATKQRR